jgi:hypothetical protein
MLDVEGICGKKKKKEEAVVVVFTRENRGGSAQHTTRATPGVAGVNAPRRS